MAKIVIRVAGPYTITYEAGRYLCCNDKAVMMTRLSTPRGEFVALVETRCKGANGESDIVGLKAEHIAMMDAADAARRAEIDARIAPQVARLNDLQRKADAYDRGHNEGGEGFNPYREQIEADLRDTDAAETR